MVLNDGRAAVLTASSLKFDPNVSTRCDNLPFGDTSLIRSVFQQVQGIWAPNIEDASCCCINHRYRLIVIGRKK